MSQYINPRGKLYGHLDRLEALQRAAGGEVKAPPINVEIDLSNRCSLGCEWCHFAHTHTRGPLAHKRTVETGDLMDTDLIRRALAEMDDYGVRSVTWSGGGEPTLHPDFDQIVTACQLPQGIYTNGGHIQTERADMLKQRCEWVYVSLDAATPQAYAKAKGVSEDRFERALAGIAELVLAKGNATIGVGFLLNADNWHDASAMATLGRDLGADYVQFRPTIRYKSEAPGQVDGDTAWIDAARLFLLDVAQMPGVEIDISRFRMLREWQGHGYPVCWWSGLQTVITPDGRVWACLNKRGYDGAVLGDLHDNRFEDIWQHVPIQAVNESCRVMCRGHIPNTELVSLFEDRVHGEFV